MTLFFADGLLNGDAGTRQAEKKYDGILDELEERNLRMLVTTQEHLVVNKASVRAYVGESC